MAAPLHLSGRSELLSGRLAALADPEHTKSRLIADLRDRIHEAWSAFPRSVGQGARGLRNSLASWLNLSDSATPDEAYAAILEGNDVKAEIRALALELLLYKCGGESAIQQGGRGYLPKFCVSQNNNGNPYSGSWDFDSIAITSAMVNLDLQA